MKKLFYFLFVLTSFKGVAQNPCNPAGQPYSKLPGDTVIVLRSGTTLTFNRCEFFDIRDCIEISEFSNEMELAEAGINMYDKDGNVLVSYGMMKIDLSKCGKTKFDVPVKFRIKLNNALSCSDTSDVFFKLYIYRANSWDDDTDISAKTITIGKDKYIEFQTTVPGFTWNIDVLKGGRLVTFVAPKGGKISELRLGTGCPLFYVKNIPSPARRKIKIRLTCNNPRRVMVESEVYFGSDSISKQKKLLADLRHAQAKLKCTSPRPKFFPRLFDWKTKPRSEFRKKYYL